MARRKTMAKAVPSVRSARAAPVGQLPILKASGTGCEKVWSGTIARLRIYDQPGSTGKKVFAYVSPGANTNYVGYSEDPNMIEALFRARDNGNAVQGYTNAQCRIEWMDY